MINTPILLITFNRPDHVRRVLTEIRKQQPVELYVCQDGARENNPNDSQKVVEVRKVIDELVDWPCNLHTLYQEKNLGCGAGPAAGISWFFENVEMGIIMEDDCLPHPDFFGYSEDLLLRYKNDNQVRFISATLYNDNWKCDASYGFSHYMRTGAWAAWRETWQGFDLDLLGMEPKQFRKKVFELTENRAESNWWYFRLLETQQDRSKKSYWDYQMQIHLFMTDSLTIHPKRNLISNIGFCGEATHTLDNDCNLGDRPTFPILPLVHPVCKDVDTRVDALSFANALDGIWYKDLLSLWYRKMYYGSHFSRKILEIYRHIKFRK